MRIRIFWKQGPGGVPRDARLVESTLRLIQKTAKGERQPWTIEHADVIQWGLQPTQADLHIYMEHVPRLAMPWARYHVAVVNPEWWPEHDCDWALAPPEQGGVNLFVFKSEPVTALFPELPASRRVVLPWKTDLPEHFDRWEDKENRFLFLMGSSASRIEVLSDLIGAWQATWPPLEIHCPPSVADRYKSVASSNIEFRTAFLSEADRIARQRACKWHCCVSAAEGFGYTMAEAAACGAPVLWCDLSVQTWTWQLGARGAVATTEVSKSPEGVKIRYREGRHRFTSEALADGVESLLAMTPADVAALQEHYHQRRRWAQHGFLDGWRTVIQKARRGADLVIPRLLDKDAAHPPVAILTVTRNRAAWWPNMTRSVLSQTWPYRALQWIVVDDSDAGSGLDKEVAVFQERFGADRIQYVRLTGAHTIGEKRNIGVRAANPAIQYFVCMDDDDHYPPMSVAIRLSWLMRKGTEIVYSSTLPMYDITRYITAINVPPIDDAPENRVSEATLAFTRSAWAAQPFPEVSMAEGAGFLSGRVSRSVEISPSGVIVSFIHRGNTSSRRVPADQEPNGCHYGFTDEYFRYLHETGGV
jgi:hypothetical protein